MMKKVTLILIFLLFGFSLNYSENDSYVVHIAKKGDSMTMLLQRYNLSLNTFNLEFFKENNRDNLTVDFGLITGKQYFLPIAIYKYDGKNIRNSIGIDDINYAKKIQSYNNKLHKKGLKKKDYKEDNEIWVPLSLKSKDISPVHKQMSTLPKNIIEPLFGEKYKNVAITGNALANSIFYIVSGHGGIDPGAIGYKDGHELHEDEYAYDVSLRLVRKLMENGAEVYMIVQDLKDGIRDELYLNNSNDEIHINNQPIPTSQNERLMKRASIINDLYNQNKQKGKSQFCIETHVDSRYTGKKVDIFFYYKDGHNEGQRMANILMKTIKDKYNKAQPGRGYEGSVSSRGLLMLRKVQPTSIFIEIGNIQNSRDQIRIIESNNRQAIANWLCDGIVKSITGK